MNLKGNWRKLSKNYLEEVYFLPWLPHFPNLQVLDISYTNANDMCLAVLGVYCTQLKYVKDSIILIQFANQS